MKCPTCPDTTLVMSDRQGIEIDYCPLCRGIWLDRGELDKLLDRAVTAPVPPRPAPPPDLEDSAYHNGRRTPYGRKKSWLSEIFD